MENYTCNDCGSNDITEWRTIPGFERYEASNKGDIRIKDSGYLLAQRTHPSGHLGVVLIVGGKKHWMKSHRVIAMAFLGQAPVGMNMVCHYPSPDKTNNNANNLRWGNAKTNWADYRESGITRNSTSYKLKPDQIRAIRKGFAQGFTKSQLARDFNISRDMVRNIVDRKAWRHVD